MKIVYRHKRVLDFGRFLNDEKGYPSQEDLFSYSRDKKWVDDALSAEFPPASRGGHTSCSLVLDEEVIGAGEALCSYSQNFSYSEGRRISLNRAIDKAESNGHTVEGVQKVYRIDEETGAILPDGRKDLVGVNA